MNGSELRRSLNKLIYEEDPETKFQLKYKDFSLTYQLDEENNAVVCVAESQIDIHPLAQIVMDDFVDRFNRNGGLQIQSLEQMGYIAVARGLSFDVLRDISDEELGRGFLMELAETMTAALCILHEVGEGYSMDTAFARHIVDEK